MKLELDYSKIDCVEVDGINTWDSPDFSDAFISYAQYEGKDMTDEMLEVLNQDTGYVYSQVEKKLH